MSFRRYKTILAAILLTAAIPATAQTGGGDVQQKREVRWITQDRFSSECVGDPKTPLCAVETWIACWARKDSTLCAKVLGEPLEPFFGNHAVPYAAEYTVESIYPITPEDITPERKGSTYYRPGVVQVELRRRFHEEDGSVSPANGWLDYVFYVHRVNGRWRLVHWEPSGVTADTHPASSWIRAGSATSNCVGEPKTPVCAIETWIACWARREMELCRRVSDRFTGNPVGNWRYEPYIAEYIVQYTYTIRAEDAAAWNDRAKFRHGQFVDSVVEKKVHRANLPNDKGWRRTWYFLQRVEGEWRVVHATGIDTPFAE